MKENQLNCKITYNNYEVLSAKRIDMIIFVKTVNKHSGEIIWFVGFATKGDFVTDVKRILNTENKYPNRYFREMFKEDYLTIPNVPIIFDNSSFTQQRYRKEIS